MHAHNIGTVDSIATLLFAAGSVRHATPQSRFHVHPVGISLRDIQTLHTLKRHIIELEQDSENICGFLAYRSNVSKESWRQYMDAHHMFTSEDACKMGFVHQIGLLPSLSGIQIYHHMDLNGMDFSFKPDHDLTCSLDKTGKIQSK